MENQNREFKPEVSCRNFTPMAHGTVSMYYGQGGIGKSFAAIRAAIEFVIENPSKKAVLWLTEEPEAVNSDRVRRLMACYDHDGDFFNERLMFINNQPLRLTETNRDISSVSDNLSTISEKLKDYDMVVLDPLLSFGGCNKDCAIQYKFLISAIEEWSAQEEKIILVLHRSFKKGDDHQTEELTGCRTVYAFHEIDKGCNIENREDYRAVKLLSDSCGYFVDDNLTTERNLLIFPPR